VWQDVFDNGVEVGVKVGIVMKTEQVTQVL